MPKSSYIALLIDRFGMQLCACETIEDVHDGLINHINEEYMVELNNLEDLMTWADRNEATIAVYYINNETLDIIEECI